MIGKNSRVPHWILWVTPLLIFAIAGKILNQNPPVNASQTSPDAEAPLRTRFYPAPWSRVVEAAQSALSAQKTYGRAWKVGQSSITGAEPGAKLRETLRAQVPVVVFTDDLEVTLSEQEDGQIRVDCESKSRIGKGDFGENKRHVTQFLRSLDANLQG